jgi:hypothetical protein
MMVFIYTSNIQIVFAGPLYRVKLKQTSRANEPSFICKSWGVIYLKYY